MIKTLIAKKEDVQRDWYVIDATDKVLGRMASRIAMILQGKTKPVLVYCRSKQEYVKIPTSFILPRLQIVLQ